MRKIITNNPNELDDDCVHYVHSKSYKLIFKKLGKNVRAFPSAQCFLPKTESRSFLQIIS